MSKLSVPAALKRAEAHVKSGEIAEAQRIYSAVLKARPNHPKALRSLKQIGGMNGHSSSEPTEAEVRKIGDICPCLYTVQLGVVSAGKVDLS